MDWFAFKRVIWGGHISSAAGYEARQQDKSMGDARRWAIALDLSPAMLAWPLPFLGDKPEKQAQKIASQPEKVIVLIYRLEAGRLNRSKH